MFDKPYTYIKGEPFYIPQRECMNGVVRLKATSLSLASKYSDESIITVPKRLLEREIRRIIEETMVYGGGIEELTCCCISAIEADVALSNPYALR